MIKKIVLNFLVPGLNFFSKRGINTFIFCDLFGEFLVLSVVDFKGAWSLNHILLDN